MNKFNPVQVLALLKAAKAVQAQKGFKPLPFKLPQPANASAP